MLLISIRWWWSGCLQEGEFKRHADVGGENRSIGISGPGWWFGKQEKKYLLEKKRGGNFFPLKEQFLPFVDFLPPTTCMLY